MFTIYVHFLHNLQYLQLNLISPRQVHAQMPPSSGSQWSNGSSEASFFRRPSKDLVHRNSRLLTQPLLPPRVSLPRAKAARTQTTPK